MTVRRVSSVTDPRLNPYRNLRYSSIARDAGLFIAEGHWLAVRLMESGLDVHSVLVEERRLDDIEPRMRDDVPLYVIPNKSSEDLVGFDFHRGVLACGIRPASKRLTDLSLGERSTIVLGCRLQDQENTGLILRNCAAFGVDAMIFGQACVDPFARRVLRVSMGNAFFTEVVIVDNLKAAIEQLREMHFDVAATVLDVNAEKLPTFQRRPRQALIFGEEARGVAQSCITAATRRVTLPMANDIDSLNVAVASGVFLYHVMASELSERP